MHRRSLVVAAAGVLALVAAVLWDAPVDSGLVGLELKASLQSSPPVDPDARFPTRSGEMVAPGTIDDRGCTPPLDIVRPKSASRRPHASSSPPRVPRVTGLFPETRLGPDDEHTQNETSIDAAGNVVVAGWNNFTDTGPAMGWAASDDGGASWTEGLFEDHSVMSDPVVKTGNAGLWCYAYLASPGPGGGDIYVRRSDDDGRTCGSPITASFDTSFEYEPYIDASDDEVVVAFTDFGFGPAKVSVTVSTNCAASFQNQTVLANNSIGGNGACPVITASADYHVFWRNSMQNFLWMATSTDQGVTWSIDRQVAPMDPVPTP